jgi:hypothetical protein
MAFGLTNTAATYQDRMNHFLHDLLDRREVVHFDDILIYSKNLKEYDLLV